VRFVHRLVAGLFGSRSAHKPARPPTPPCMSRGAREHLFHCLARSPHRRRVMSRSTKFNTAAVTGLQPVTVPGAGRFLLSHHWGGQLKLWSPVTRTCVRTWDPATTLVSTSPSVPPTGAGSALDTAPTEGRVPLLFSAPPAPPATAAEYRRLASSGVAAPTPDAQAIALGIDTAAAASSTVLPHACGFRNTLTLAGASSGGRGVIAVADYAPTHFAPAASAPPPPQPGVPASHEAANPAAIVVGPPGAPVLCVLTITGGGGGADPPDIELLRAVAGPLPARLACPPLCRCTATEVRLAVVFATASVVAGAVPSGDPAAALTGWAAHCDVPLGGSARPGEARALPWTPLRRALRRALTAAELQSDRQLVGLSADGSALPCRDEGLSILSPNPPTLSPLPSCVLATGGGLSGRQQCVLTHARTGSRTQESLSPREGAPTCQCF